MLFLGTSVALSGTDGGGDDPYTPLKSTYECKVQVIQGHHMSEATVTIDPPNNKRYHRFTSEDWTHGVPVWASDNVKGSWVRSEEPVTMPLPYNLDGTVVSVIILVGPQPTVRMVLTYITGDDAAKVYLESEPKLLGEKNLSARLRFTNDVTSTHNEAGYLVGNCSATWDDQLGQETEPVKPGQQSNPLFCTPDLNEHGHPSGCVCPEDYKYDSQNGTCILES